MAKHRINQVIGQGGEEIERVLLNILRAATEDVSQTHFHLLERFSKQQLENLKSNIELLKILIYMYNENH